MDEEPQKPYPEIIQDFFKVEPAAPSSIRENLISSGVIPGIETEEQKKQKQIEKRGVELRRRTIQMLMATDQGREWLYDLLHGCNVFGTPFNPDTHATAFNCGALYIGRKLEDDI